MHSDLLPFSTPVSVRQSEIFLSKLNFYSTECLCTSLHGSVSLVATIGEWRTRKYMQGKSLGFTEVLYLRSSHGSLWSPQLSYLECVRTSIYSSVQVVHQISVPRFCRESSVGIATGYGLEGRRVVIRAPVETRISLITVVQTDSGALLSNGHQGLFHGGNAAGAWHWPPTSAEVNNTWI
jgi:hypothetical protein